MKTSPAISFRRILVPVDFSPTERNTLHYAVDLARKMGGKITLLHVVEPAYAGPEPALAYIPMSTETLETAGRKRLLDIAHESIPLGMFDKTILRLGSPYYEIAETARDMDADLIVISTHGRTGLSHVLMGSTAERVVRHAPCPVLTVRMANAAGKSHESRQPAKTGHRRPRMVHVGNVAPTRSHLTRTRASNGRRKVHSNGH